jgi:hypothetical protein
LGRYNQILVEAKLRRLHGILRLRCTGVESDGNSLLIATRIETLHSKVPIFLLALREQAALGARERRIL